MLLSRVAETLYWTARYLERAESTARVISEHTHLLVDLPVTVPLTWEPLLAITGSGPAFGDRYPTPDERSIIAFLLADRHNPSSVVSSIVAARENLRTTREVVPRAAWQALNDLYLYTTSHHTEAVDRRSRGRFLERVIASCERLGGIVSSSMSRDEAYQMLRLGLHIERADMTSRVLDVRACALLAAPDDGSAPVHDEVQWTAVLRSLSAQQAYLRSRRGPVTGHPTVTFLLCDPDFPGSIAHCLAGVEAVAAGLPRGEAVDASARAAVRTLATVANRPLESLHKGIDELQVAIGAVHDEVQSTYFPPLPGEVTTIDVRAGGSEPGPGAGARNE